MADTLYTVMRVDGIQSTPTLIATFYDIKDVPLFVDAYMELHKYDDCAPGFPRVDLYHNAIGSDGKIVKTTPMKHYYPNAHDCAFVESVESPQVRRQYVRMGAKHGRN